MPPSGKYEYQKLPMGLCNGPDICQETMNKLFNGLGYVRTYIDDLLTISNKSFKDHINKLDQLPDKWNKDITFFAKKWARIHRL